MIAHILIIFLVFDGRVFDDRCEILTLVLIHLEEHLLALAAVWLVVVDEQIAQDPLIQLQPSLEAAAELASAASAASRFVVSLRLLLIRVERLTVLALPAGVGSLAVDIFDKRVFGEEVGLH